MPENLTNLAQILEKCDCNDLSALYQHVLTDPNMFVTDNK